MVLDLIIEDEGGNLNVESKLDKSYREPSPEAECLEEEVKEEKVPMSKRPRRLHTLQNAL